MNKTTKFLGAFFGALIGITILAVLAAKNTTILITYSLVIPLVVFIYPRILCTTELYNMETYGSKNKSKKFLCYIPVYNTYYSRKMQYMSAPVVGGLLLYSVVELFIINPVLRFSFNTGDIGLIINVIISWVNIITLLILWGVEAYVNVALARQVAYNNKVLCILIPPIGSYFLSKQIRVYFRKNKDEIRGTFKEAK